MTPFFFINNLSKVLVFENSQSSKTVLSTDSISYINVQKDNILFKKMLLLRPLVKSYAGSRYMMSQIYLFTQIPQHSQE